MGFSLSDDESFQENLTLAKQVLSKNGIEQEQIRDLFVSKIVCESEAIYRDCVQVEEGYNARDRRLDRLLTSKATGIPIMLALLFLIFWITISGANYPSELLFACFRGLRQDCWNGSLARRRL